MHFELGTQLKELRRIKGEAIGHSITQEEIAKELGVRYATYNGWENNYTTPRRIDDWCKLADYFNITLDYLMRGDSTQASYVPFRDREDKGIKWRVNTDRLSERLANAVKVFGLFANGKTDDEIMNIMKVDMSDIQDMLLDAMRDGPVEVTGLNRDHELEDALKKKYKGHGGLIDARVFSIGETNFVFSKLLVSWGAKEYLLDELRKPFASRILIGIAGGTTLANMFRFIKRGEWPHTSICPLGISPVEVATGVDPNAIIGDLAYRQQNLIDAFIMPYVSRQTRNVMDNIKYVPPEVLAARRILRKAANVDMAFLGVGALDDVMSYMMGEFFRPAGGMTIEELKQKAVGDILYHIVDEKAQILDQHYDDFLCSIELDVLKNMVLEGKRVVLVTHSGRKDISKVAIDAHLVNVVIMDDVLARSLLNGA